MARDPGLIRDNVRRMIQGGAQDNEIDEYLRMENVTPAELRASKAPEQGWSPAGEADRAVRRFGHNLTLGLSGAPADAFTATVGGTDYKEQRAKTKEALKYNRGPLGTVADIGYDTAGLTAGAVATIPLTIHKTGVEMLRGGLRTLQDVTARSLAPRGEAAVAADVVAQPVVNQLMGTRKAIARESTKIGAGFGVVGGYGNAADDAGLAGTLGSMAEHTAGGAVLGRIIPAAINVWGDYVTGPIRNALMARKQARAETANARADDFARSNTPTFTPALSDSPVLQGTAAGLEGTLFGGSLRAGAGQSIRALENQIQQDLRAAGANKTASEAGEEAKEFLKYQLTDKSKKDEQIAAMSPQQLQDISGLAPRPDYNPQPPTVEATPPRQVIPARPDAELARVRSSVEPTPAIEPPTVEPQYRPVPRVVVGTNPDLRRRLTDLYAERDRLSAHMADDLDPALAHITQQVEQEPFFRFFAGEGIAPEVVHRWKPVLDRYASGGPRNAQDEAELINFARWIGDTDRAQRILSVHRELTEVNAARRQVQERQYAMEREIPATERDAQVAYERNYESTNAARRRLAQQDAERATEAARMEARDRAAAETRARQDEAVRLARPAAEERAAQATERAQADAVERAARETRARQQAEDARFTADLDARKARSDEPFGMGRSKETYLTEFDAGYRQVELNTPTIQRNPLGDRTPRGLPKPREDKKYSADEIENAVAGWEFTSQVTLPERLTGFIRRLGGIRDTGKEVRHLLGGITGAGRLINNKGRALDDIGEAAQQAGFFTERPTVAELLNKLHDDLRGQPVVRQRDEEALIALREARDIATDLDKLGVLGAKSADEVRALLGRQTVKVPPEPYTLSQRRATVDVLESFATEARGMGELTGFRPNIFDENGRLKADFVDWLRPHLGKRITDQLVYLSERRSTSQMSPAIQGLHDMKTIIGRTIRELRESGKSGYIGTPRSENDTMLSRLEKALDKDITAFRNEAVTAAGGLSARQRASIDAAWGEYNNELRKPLSKIFGDKVDSGAAIAELVAATQSGTKKIDTLKAFYRVARDKGDELTATSWLLHDMMKDGLPGFLQRYRAISDDARRMMFSGNARALGEALDNHAKVGGYLEKFIKSAGDDYTIDLSKALRPGNVGIGLTYFLGMPALIKTALGAMAASRVLSSKWLGGWLLSYPIQKAPRSPEWMRHMNRLRSLATEDLDLNKETARAFYETIIGPAKAQQAPSDLLTDGKAGNYPRGGGAGQQPGGGGKGSELPIRANFKPLPAQGGGTSNPAGAIEKGNRQHGSGGRGDGSSELPILINDQMREGPRTQEQEELIQTQAELNRNPHLTREEKEWLQQGYSKNGSKWDAWTERGGPGRYSGPPSRPEPKQRSPLEYNPAHDKPPLPGRMNLGGPLPKPEGDESEQAQEVLFGGKKARTADHGMRAKAESLLKKGGNHEEVWQQTGWFKDERGRMRFEIDDSKATINRDAIESGRRGLKIRDIIKHPLLEAAYPHIMNHPVEVVANANGWVGQVQSRSDGGVLLRIARSALNPGVDPEYLRRVIIHELQHVIQTAEDGLGGYAITQPHHLRPDEVESHNAERRHAMTKEERAVAFPRSTESRTPNAGLEPALGKAVGRPVRREDIEAAEETQRRLIAEAEEAHRTRRAAARGGQTKGPAYSTEVINRGILFGAALQNDNENALLAGRGRSQNRREMSNGR